VNFTDRHGLFLDANENNDDGDDNPDYDICMLDPEMPGCGFPAAAPQPASSFFVTSLVVKANQLNSIQRGQAAQAVEGLSSNCDDWLSADGINMNQVAATAAAATYYATYLEGSLTVNSIVASFDTSTLNQAVGGNIAISLVNAFGQFANDVVLGSLYFTTVEYGPNLATSQNVVLVHEALHNATGWGDTTLASNMGLGDFPNTPAGIQAASQAISNFLAGCY
jgi:hypothetical protein